LENDNYKLYFDRTVLTDIHIKYNRPDIIVLNKQQKQAKLPCRRVDEGKKIVEGILASILELNHKTIKQESFTFP
jgi:hypothetical protein